MANTTGHEEPVLLGSEPVSVNKNIRTCTTSYPGKLESTTTLPRESTIIPKLVLHYFYHHLHQFCPPLQPASLRPTLKLYAV